MEQLYKRKQNGRYEPIDQKMSLNEEILLACAFRYCLGRRTYVVSSCVSELKRKYTILSEHFKDRTKKEIDDADFEENLGDSFDALEWRTIRNLMDMTNRYTLLANKYQTDEWVKVQAFEMNGKYYSIPSCHEYHTVKDVQPTPKEDVY